MRVDQDKYSTLKSSIVDPKNIFYQEKQDQIKTPGREELLYKVRQQFDNYTQDLKVDKTNPVNQHSTS